MSTVCMVMTLETELFPRKSIGFFSCPLSTPFLVQFTLTNWDSSSVPPPSLLPSPYLLSSFLQPVSFLNIIFGTELSVLPSFSDPGKVQPILIIPSSNIVCLIISNLVCVQNGIFSVISSLETSTFQKSCG